MPIGQKQTEPYHLNYVTANRFYVQIGGVINSCFTECSGLGMTIKHQPFSEGGVNNQQKFFLGHPTFNDITLKKGVTDDLTFWQWGSQVLRGFPQQRLNISILLFNQSGQTMQTYLLIGAVPVGWKAPSFQADSTSVAIEELTIAYEGLKIYSTTPVGSSSGKATESAILSVGMVRDKLGYFLGS
jgi:phage tail-like protein